MVCCVCHTATSINNTNIKSYIRVFLFLKNVGCEYDRLNGWSSTKLQAAWYMRHVLRWTCFFYISFIIWFLWTKQDILKNMYLRNNRSTSTWYFEVLRSIKFRKSNTKKTSPEILNKTKSRNHKINTWRPGTSRGLLLYEKWFFSERKLPLNFPETPDHFWRVLRGAPNTKTKPHCWQR